MLDDFTISTIPALSLLDRLLRRPPLADGGTVILGYTHADAKTEKGAWERAIFLGEAVQAGQQLGVTPLLDAADMYGRLWAPDGQKQMGEAQALRRGELIPANKNFDPSDPYYWSPFVLIGDWR